MPTKDEMKAAIKAAVDKVKADVLAAVAKEKEEVTAAIHTLQNQIDAGTPVTSADLADIVASIQDLGTSSVAAIDTIEQPPIVTAADESGGGTGQ